MKRWKENDKACCGYLKHIKKHSSGFSLIGKLLIFLQILTLCTVIFCLQKWKYYICSQNTWIFRQLLSDVRNPFVRHIGESNNTFYIFIFFSSFKYHGHISLQEDIYACFLYISPYYNTDFFPYQYNTRIVYTYVCT